MKIILNSLSDKKVRYKVYDLNGKKRRLLCKGKFLHKTEAEISPRHSEIIVRVSRGVSPFSFLYVWFMQLIVFLSDTYKSTSKLNYMWETKISGVKEGDTVEVTYSNAVPETGRTYDAASRLGEPDALFCTTHPSKKITSFITRQIWIETAAVALSAIVIIAAICLIYFKCIGAY